jgi:hypothetical protein
MSEEARSRERAGLLVSTRNPEQAPIPPTGSADDVSAGGMRRLVPRAQRGHCPWRPFGPPSPRISSPVAWGLPGDGRERVVPCAEAGTR